MPRAKTYSSRRIADIEKTAKAALSVASAAGVSSFKGRTGAVTPALDDYTWAQINKTTSDIADITTRSHTSLTDIGSNTHDQIDTHIGVAVSHIAATSAHGATGNIVGLDDDPVTWTGVHNFQGGTGNGDYTVAADIDITIGDIADYGLANFGKAIFGRTSRVTGALDLDGTVIIRSSGNPATSNILFAFLDGTNTMRFALPQSGTGNATYNPRSMLIAGPCPVDDTAVTVGYWQGTGIFDNLACDTSGNGADLGVQNDCEIEGDLFIDSIKESTSAAGITFVHETIHTVQQKLTEIAAPGTPATGFGYLYAATDGTLHYINDAASDVDLSAGGGIADSDNVVWTGTHEFQNATPVQFNEGIKIGDGSLANGLIQSSIGLGSGKVPFRFELLDDWDGGVITYASQKVFQFWDSVNSKAYGYATVAGFTTFGYDTAIQAGVVLGFAAATTNCISGAASESEVQTIGMLPFIDHNNATITPSYCAGVIAGAGCSDTAATIPSGEMAFAGMAAYVFSGHLNDRTGYSSKVACALRIGYGNAGSRANSMNSVLDFQRNSFAPYGDWQHVTGIWADMRAFSTLRGTADPTNRPAIASYLRLPIPGVGSTSQYAIYGEEITLTTASLNACTTSAFARIPFPQNTSATNRSHLHFLPHDGGTGGPTWAAAGGVYFDDGGTAGVREGLYEYDNGLSEWKKCRPTITKSFSLENPVTGEDRAWFYTPIAITLREIVVVLKGTSPSIPVTVSHSTSRASGYTTAWSLTCTSTTTGNVSTTFSDATIPANSFIRVTTSGTVTADELFISLEFTED